MCGHSYVHVLQYYYYTDSYQSHSASRRLPRPACALDATKVLYHNVSTLSFAHSQHNWFHFLSFGNPLPSSSSLESRITQSVQHGHQPRQALTADSSEHGVVIVGVLGLLFTIYPYTWTTERPSEFHIGSVTHALTPISMYQTPGDRFLSTHHYSRDNMGQV
jgi:hypothetical protein